VERPGEQAIMQSCAEAKQVMSPKASYPELPPWLTQWTAILQRDGCSVIS